MYERLGARVHSGRVHSGRVHSGRVHSGRVQCKTNCIEVDSAFRYAWNGGGPANFLKGKEQERQLGAYFSFQASDGHDEFLSWSNLGHAAYVRSERRSCWCMSFLLL